MFIYLLISRLLFLSPQEGITCSGVDSIGTVSASLVAYASIQALKPDLIINAGTAGGLKVRLFTKMYLLCCRM